MANEIEKKDMIPTDENVPAKVEDGTSNEPKTNIEALLDETQKTVDNNTDAEADAAAADQTSDKNGAPGPIEEKKARNGELLGSFTGNVTQTSASKSINVVDTGSYVSFVDADADSRNKARAERIAKNVEAKIVREGTPAAEQDQIAVAGAVGESDIYPLDSTAVRRIVGGVGMRAGINSPIHTDSGSVLISKDGVVALTDDYLYETSKTKGHLGEKKFTQHKFFMLNEIDSHLRFTGKYRLIRTGKYLITGFNPLWASKAGRADVIGYVKREGGVAEVKTSNHNMFNVIDVTAVLDDVKATCHDLAIHMVANKSRMVIGAIEKLADTIRRTLDNKMNDANTIEYPEFYSQIQRSTINELDTAFTAGVDRSCYNSQEAIALIMRDFMQSEGIWLKVRTPFGLEATDWLKGIKAQKALMGKRNSFPYYSHVAKADPAENFGLNTVVEYLKTMDSTNKYDNWAKLLYVYTKIRTDFEEMMKAFDDSHLANELLAKVRISEDKLQQIVDTLAYGKMGFDSNTTSDIVKKGGNVGLIIGFNPNDLIDFESANVVALEDDKSYTRPHLCCGWVNYRSKSGSNINDKYVYNFAPSWVEAIVRGLNNDKLVSEIVYNKKATKTRICSKYDCHSCEPITYQHDHLEWVDIILLALAARDSNPVLDLALPNSGYLHLMQGYEEFGLLDALLCDISVKDAIAKVTNNLQLYPQDKAASIMDYPVLWDSAINAMQSKNIEHQIAVLTGSGKSTIVMQPDQRDMDQHGLYDYTQVNGLEAGEKLTTAMELIMKCLEKVAVIDASGNRKSKQANPEHKYTLVPLGEDEYIVCINSSIGKFADDMSSFEPLKLNRCIPTEDEAFRSFRVPTDGSGAIGSSHETPAEALYGHDDFYWADFCDYYVLRLRKSYLVGDTTYKSSQNGKDTFAGSWMIDVCPAFECEGKQFSEKGMQADVSSNAPTIVVKPANTYNLLYTAKDCKTLASLNYERGKGPGAVGDQYKSGATVKESLYLKMLTIPSLYGGKRRMPMGALLTKVRAVNEQAQWRSFIPDYVATGKTGVKLTDVDTSCNDCEVLQMSETGGYAGINYEAYAYIPVDAYALAEGEEAYRDAYADIEALTGEEISQLMEAGNIDISQAKFWVKQEPKMFNVMGLADNSGATVTALEPLFADCNKAIYPAAFADIDDYTLSVKDSKGKVNVMATPGNHIAPATYQSIHDYWEKYGVGKEYFFIPAALILSARKDTLGADKPGIMAVMPAGLAINPVLMSAYYYCDYRDYSTHKPILYYNRKWATRGLDTSFFAGHFLAKSE